MDNNLFSHTKNYLTFLYSSALGECLNMDQLKLDDVPRLVANCFVNICVYNNIPYDMSTMNIFKCDNLVCGGEIAFFKQAEMIHAPHIFISMPLLKQFIDTKANPYLNVIDKVMNTVKRCTVTSDSYGRLNESTQKYNGLIIKTIVISEHLFMHFLDYLVNGCTDWQNHCDYSDLNYKACIASVFDIVILCNKPMIKNNEMSIKIRDVDRDGDREYDGILDTMRFIPMLDDVLLNFDVN